MRDSAVPDGLIAVILGLDGASAAEPVGERTRQALNYWEKPFRDAGPQRDRKARADLGFAVRRLRKAGRQAASDGLAPEDDPRNIEGEISFLEAMEACFRAEAACGAFTAWLPEFMRDDPYTELHREIERMRARIVELERVALLRTLAKERAARAARREAAVARLSGRRAALTTDQFGKLPAEERSRIEADLGLQIPVLPDATFTVSYSDEIRHALPEVARKRHSAHRRAFDSQAV